MLPHYKEVSCSQKLVVYVTKVTLDSGYMVMGPYSCIKKSQIEIVTEQSVAIYI